MRKRGRQRSIEPASSGKSKKWVFILFILAAFSLLIFTNPGYVKAQESETATPTPSLPLVSVTHTASETETSEFENTTATIAATNTTIASSTQTPTPTITSASTATPTIVNEVELINAAKQALFDFLDGAPSQDVLVSNVEINGVWAFGLIVVKAENRQGSSPAIYLFIGNNSESD